MFTAYMIGYFNTHNRIQSLLASLSEWKKKQNQQQKCNKRPILEIRVRWFKNASDRPEEEKLKLNLICNGQCMKQVDEVAVEICDFHNEGWIPWILRHTIDLLDVRKKKQSSHTSSTHFPNDSFTVFPLNGKHTQREHEPSECGCVFHVMAIK